MGRVRVQVTRVMQVMGIVLVVHAIFGRHISYDAHSLGKKEQQLPESASSSPGDLQKQLRAARTQQDTASLLQLWHASSDLKEAIHRVRVEQRLEGTDPSLEELEKALVQQAQHPAPTRKVHAIQDKAHTLSVTSRTAHPDPSSNPQGETSTSAKNDPNSGIQSAATSSTTKPAQPVPSPHLTRGHAGNPTKQQQHAKPRQLTPAANPASTSSTALVKPPASVTPSQPTTGTPSTKAPNTHTKHSNTHVKPTKPNTKIPNNTRTQAAPVAQAQNTATSHPTTRPAEHQARPKASRASTGTGANPTLPHTPAQPKTSPKSPHLRPKHSKPESTSTSAIPAAAFPSRTPQPSKPPTTSKPANQASTITIPSTAAAATSANRQPTTASAIPTAQAASAEPEQSSPPPSTAAEPEQSSPLIPEFVPFRDIQGHEGDDVYSRLHRYLRELGTTSRVDSISEAAARQQHPRAEDLGLWALDRLSELDSLADRVEFINQLIAQQGKGEPLAAKVAICTTWTGNLQGVRRDLLPWITYHTRLGVSRFYIQYDGQDAQVLKHLRGITSVRLGFMRRPFASDAQVKAWEAAQETATKEWQGRPGNWALLIKQEFGMTQALRAAEKEKVDWLLHLDADELIYLGGRHSDLPQELASQPESVHSLSFMSFEAQLESGGLVNKWEQVTLFRAHDHFLSKEAYELYNAFRLGSTPTFIRWYINGKSAVRVSSMPPGTFQPWGPHTWMAESNPRWVTPANPEGRYQVAVSQGSLVLHYTYCYLSDIAHKAKRTCPPEFVQAAREGNGTKVMECVWNMYDHQAYMLSAKGNLTAVRDFFYNTAVLSEGAPVNCHNDAKGWGWCGLQRVEQLKEAMIKAGLLARIKDPRMIMQQLETQFRVFQVERRASSASARPPLKKGSRGTGAAEQGALSRPDR